MHRRLSTKRGIEFYSEASIGHFKIIRDNLKIINLKFYKIGEAPSIAQATTLNPKVNLSILMIIANVKIIVHRINRNICIDRK